MPSPLGFNAGGIDATSIVQSLMDAERLPVETLRKKTASVKLQSDAVGRVKSSLETLRSASAEIVSRGLARTAATSSSTAVQATALTGALTGSLSFNVNRLASAQGLRTSTSVASTSAQVTTQSRLALSTTGAKTGMSDMSASSAVAAGTYAVAVTQASTAATLTGSDLAASVNVNPGTQGLTFNISGSSVAISLTSGTYTREALAAEIQSKLTAAGGGATVSVSPTGALKFTATNEGSAASLMITGGNARNLLGLNGLAAPNAGTDAKVTVDGGAEMTLTAVGPGQVSNLAVGGGTLAVSFAAGARVGTTSVSVVSTGDGSLAAVASAVNASSAGVTGAAVKQADGAWLLQIASKSTGAASTITIDSAAFTGVGGLIQTAAGEDAQLTVGSGAGAYTVTSATNVFTDLLPGVSVTATATTASAVTVSVVRDDAASAALVEKLVNSVNSLVADIKVQTRYDAATRVSSPLTNDTRIKSISSRVRAALTDAVDGAGLTLTDIGVSAAKDGSLTFDRTKFDAVMKSNPTAVERAFARGGSTDNGVSWAAALDSTKAGTYTVDVTTAATRAATATLFASSPGSATVIGVKSGSTTATVNIAAGATQSQMVASVNASLASAGIAATAVADGTGFAVRANSFGLAGTFELNPDLNGAGTYTSYAGVDAAGTIGGLAATASGSKLSLSASAESPAKGLAVDTAGVIGPVSASVKYAPGAAARLSALVAELNETAGAVSISAAAYDKRMKGFESQIDRLEDKLAVRQQTLTRQWGKVQANLTSLQSQQEWLANQVQSLAG